MKKLGILAFLTFVFATSALATEYRCFKDDGRFTRHSYQVKLVEVKGLVDESVWFMNVDNKDKRSSRSS